MRLAPALAVVAALAATGSAHAEVVAQTDRGFVIEHELVVPATPEAAYDAMTGDISAWWDHSFSERPARLYIEAKPGGGFYEIFDESGDGVLHARVIYAQRGKLLRFHGPLGLSGEALDLVVTYEYKAVDDGCLVKVTAKGAGDIDDKWPGIIDSVWHHFLFERLKPYLESRNSQE